MRSQFASRSRIRAASIAFALLLCSQFYAAAESWQVLKSCRLLTNQANDADSFHVSAGGKEYLFRLYFADAAETDASVLGRVKDQAQYFGITLQQTVLLGKIAKRFAREKLARSFTVRTCLQDAMGRSRMPRFYAFIETADGDLAELLVANGLARVYGSAATPLGLSSPEREWQKLKRLEREAQVQKVGGWGAGTGRMAARLPAQPAKSGPESFEAFFHPEQTAVAAESDASDAITRCDATSSSSIFPGSSDAKLDLNNATSTELLSVPGIGPVTARRIIEARPFESADDLRGVKGIGEKKFEKLRPFFR